MTEVKAKIFECTVDNAPRFWNWIHKRGGLLLWKSVNLSNPGQTWTTPALIADGKPFPKSDWQMANDPSDVTTNPDEVMVVTNKEVRRFRVGVRRSGNGMSMKVTDAGSRRIRATVDKLNEDREDNMASYHFDYETQEAVFTVPDKIISLTEWANQNPELAANALG